MPVFKYIILLGQSQSDYILESLRIVDSKAVVFKYRKARFSLRLNPILIPNRRNHRKAEIASPPESTHTHLTH